MKKSILILTVIVVFGGAFLKPSITKEKSEAGSEFSVGDIFKLPKRLMTKLAKEKDIQSLSVEEAREEMKRIDEREITPELVQKMNANQVTQGERDRIEKLLERRNQLWSRVMQDEVASIQKSLDEIKQNHRQTVENLNSEFEKEIQ